MTMIAQTSKLHIKAYISKLKGVYKVSITPELAQAWLLLNNSNRRIDKDLVQKYRKAMKEDLWMLNGETIIFSVLANLLNGQHRLLAISELDRSIDIFVCFGIEDEAFTTLDQGKKRTLGDLLNIDGIKSATNLAATIKAIDSLKRQHLGTNYGTKGKTNEWYYNWYYENTEVAEYVKLGQKLYKLCLGMISQSEISAFMWVCSEYDSTISEKFYTKLCAGIGLEEDDTIFKLRMILQRANSRNLNRNQILTNTYKRALIIKTWNYHIKDMKIKRLHFDPKREKHPTLILKKNK